MVNRTMVTREQIAKPVVDLVEQFGFKWEDVDEYSLPDLSHRIQIRNESNYAPAGKVSEIRAAMERGDRLPPLSLRRTGTLSMAIRASRPPYGIGFHTSTL